MWTRLSGDVVNSLSFNVTACNVPLTLWKQSGAKSCFKMTKPPYTGNLKMNEASLLPPIVQNEAKIS